MNKLRDTLSLHSGCLKCAYDRLLSEGSSSFLGQQHTSLQWTKLCAKEVNLYGKTFDLLKKTEVICCRIRRKIAFFKTNSWCVNPRLYFFLKLAFLHQHEAQPKGGSIIEKNVSTFQKMASISLTYLGVKFEYMFVKTNNSLYNWQLIERRSFKFSSNEENHWKVEMPRSLVLHIIWI